MPQPLYCLFSENRYIQRRLEKLAQEVTKIDEILSPLQHPSG